MAGLLLETVGRALTGDALGNRCSPFAGRQGEHVAAAVVRLVDDGTFTAAPAGAPFEDEGVRGGYNADRRRGVNRSFAQLRHGGVDRPGGLSWECAPRQPQGASWAAPTTLRLESPSDPPVEVGGDAVYVQQVTGSVTGISSVTGRVSLGGVGFVMRDGQPAGRLPTLPIGTTLQALLQEVTGIKGDAVVASDRPVLAPTVLWRPQARQG